MILKAIKGQNYDYWKQRMMTFFDACHIDMWDSRDFKIFVEQRIEDKNQNMRKSIVASCPKKCETLLL
ncbi:hypothetical protein CR513_09019, partial [Mucuna pruriens]